MKAILRKTVSSDFQAGDVIRGENSRITRLRDNGLVIMDHSILGMIGSIITFVLSTALLIFLVLTFFPEIDRYLKFTIPLYWSITLFILLFIIIFLNIAFFLNGNIPYVTYFLNFGTNIIGGIFVMSGHEKASSKYQPNTISSSAAVVLYTLGALSLILLVVGIVNYNTEIFYENIWWKNITIWIFYILLVTTGSFIGVLYDLNYQNRRRRFINFLRKKNAIVKYKEKALNTYKAYQKTGNADEFMKKNILFLEETLGIDQKQLEDEIKESKKI